MDMDINTYFGALKIGLKPYLESLKSFQFSYFNPLFWVFIFILFLILLRIWEIKKSFSYCVLLSLILLATTELETWLAGIWTKSGETFDPLLIRILTFLVIVIISIYYATIKEIMAR